VSKEQITITVSLEQAEAIVSAANCVHLCAEGHVAQLAGTWVPTGAPDSAEADRYIVAQAELADEVAQLLQPEIDAAYKRDPIMQQLLHSFKMMRKHGINP
jgi:hypothetical protein